jgi:maltodextrin utilization protein YvdJ
MQFLFTYESFSFNPGKLTDKHKHTIEASNQGSAIAQAQQLRDEHLADFSQDTHAKIARMRLSESTGKPFWYSERFKSKKQSDTS